MTIQVTLIFSLNPLIIFYCGATTRKLKVVSWSVPCTYCDCCN